ncbi:MAG TPA: histidine kinase [Burkholderiales bacterium]|nr:histidine kinase [Burkholderiales bacterium]
MGAEGDRLPPQFLGAESVDARMVALMRSMLAVSALDIFVFDPFQPSHFSTAIYVALLCYGLYSVALCIAITGGRMPLPPRSHHWIDAAAGVLLVALAQGVTDMFFFFFFFAILVASFSRGFGEGLTLTAISVALLVAIFLYGVKPGVGFDFDDLVTRPVFLLVLGYMTAYWGGKELLMRRRLRLLRDLAAVANPRLGIDHARDQGLLRMLEAFDVSSCVLVSPRGTSNELVMYRLDAGGRRALPQPLTAEAAEALLGLPIGFSTAWHRGKALATPELTLQCERLANLLEAEFYATVPYEPREGSRGRLYLLAARRLSDADAEFLRQVVDQIAAVADKLALMEAIMAGAAQLERSRISRDIHDTTLQPYIGLKLGLEALQRRLERSSRVRKQLDELVEMSRLVVHDLRAYVARLRREAAAGEATSQPAEHLMAGLHEHLQRYRNFFGIEVELRSDKSSALTDRVAAEAYQIVCEGLSNIHRHTPAKRAFVELRFKPDSLAIEIGNECAPAVPPIAFMPRSIAERARALGGTTTVELHERGHDIVRVAIPL